MKYQFCIRFENTTVNSAATKAVLDCNEIFLEEGYTDYTITVWDNANKVKYYLLLIRELVKFFGSIKKGSVVAIQYPLLSINNVFNVFITLARLKGVKFFCVIHDLEALRVGGGDKRLTKHEIYNLNSFDYVIVHNNLMLRWLQKNGFTKKAVPLELFDYLSGDFKANAIDFEKTIVFAGNLNKSTFIYSLFNIRNWSFNIYGPNYNKDKNYGNNSVKWCGEYSPKEIVTKLNGNFGLIWDGDEIDKCDEILGNYLKFNNPHKFSLYIAAGMPVIAPANSAIGIFIVEHNIGMLVDNLYDLDSLKVEPQSYQIMKANVMKLREKVINGYFLKMAIQSVEQELL